ncbi:MAG: cupin domain-containing protein, partial [Bdellovibrionales bacterium]|nr:cupin domain-containing protein [Bdellovibrionales bacterium]
AQYRIHVASIERQVGCHVHRRGDEDYAIVSGAGVLHFAAVDGNSLAPTVPAAAWNQLEVCAGDSFVIPEGVAHQLRRTGDAPLTILFGCPDSHLDDSIDRTMLPDAPA